MYFFFLKTQSKIIVIIIINDLFKKKIIVSERIINNEGILLINKLYHPTKNILSFKYLSSFLSKRKILKSNFKEIQLFHNFVIVVTMKI